MLVKPNHLYIHVHVTWILLEEQEAPTGLFNWKLSRRPVVPLILVRTKSLGAISFNTLNDSKFVESKLAPMARCMSVRSKEAPRAPLMSSMASRDILPLGVHLTPIQEHSLFSAFVSDLLQRLMVRLLQVNEDAYDRWQKVDLGKNARRGGEGVPATNHHWSLAFLETAG